MRIAFFCPLNPMKSGIADYCEELLPNLKKYFEIELFIDNYKPTNENITDLFKISKISDFHSLNKQNRYDEIIYQIGNNSLYHEAIYDTALQLPGIVVMHDYSIHHLVAERTVARGMSGKYIEEMFYNHGEEGKRIALESLANNRKVIWETGESLKYPLNKRLIDKSKGIIMHSKYFCNIINNIRPDLPIKHIPLPTPEIIRVSENEKALLRKKYNIPEDKIVFASFGLITKHKRVDVVLRCMKQLSTYHKDFLYLLVGEEYKGIYEMSKYIRELRLENYARYIGYVKLDSFKDYIKLSDVCINLRYPTQGESSASLIRILGMGKPAIVTNIGTFSEMPDEFCLKVSTGEKEVEDIYKHIEYLMNNPKKIKVLGNQAYEYIKMDHTIDIAANKYHKFVEDIHSGKVVEGNVYAYKSLVECTADRLSEIGIGEESTDTIWSIAKLVNSLF